MVSILALWWFTEQHISAKSISGLEVCLPLLSLYERGEEATGAIWKCISIFIIGGNTESTHCETDNPDAQARECLNPSVVPQPWRYISRSAEWILFFPSKCLQSARRIWIENVTVPHSIKGSTYGMPTQQNVLEAQRRWILQRRINEQSTVWLLTILVFNEMWLSKKKTIVDLLLVDVETTFLILTHVLCVNCLTSFLAKPTTCPLRCRPKTEWENNT